jgi:type I restriction enzyme S subunit
MQVDSGYKISDVGVFPEDWEVKPLTILCIAILDCHHSTPVWTRDGVIVLRNQNIRDGKLDLSKPSFTDEKHFIERIRRALPTFGDLVITREAPMGEVCMIPPALKCCLGQRMVLLRPNKDTAESLYLLYAIQSAAVQRSIRIAGGTGSTVSNLRIPVLKQLMIPAPKPPEQRAIAEALSDADALLGALDQLIAKKRDLKQAAMQQLLTGQTRLPGFHGEWKVKTLEQSTDCLDGVRVPLNDAQRAAMRGEYPYCGANGVLDHVNGYVIDDDIILMAEDGGYFDEYDTRPIAYRMKGKCWVNNHAHILKAKAGFDQGFLFYSLVHKNILPFLASGTRAKLNKSEMNKIEVRFPPIEAEQTAIAEVLTDIDAELAALERRREKTRSVKQAMMQQLLTGRTRLISPEEAHA